jgi:hypothetical protein
VFGVRLFNNLAIIRRILLERLKKQVAEAGKQEQAANH